MSLLSRIDHFVEHDLCHTKIGLQLMTLLRNTGISRSIRRRIVYAMMDKGRYPGDAAASRAFFSENTARIDRICDWLSDDESKETFKQAIAFRMSLKREDLPRQRPEKEQYFDEVVDLSDGEVFVDCGAYIGDTVDTFLKRVHNRYRRIVCFEPDEQNYRFLQKKKIPNLTVIQGGVYHENTQLAFESGNATGSSFVEDRASGKELVPVYQIDSVPECADATFIKMDIEGSELSALKGAEKTILRNHPKLAICIYHSDEDMLSIAEYIHSIPTNYKLYVRHYSCEKYETVLYAV